MDSSKASENHQQSSSVTYELPCELQLVKLTFSHILADDSFIKFDLVDRKGKSTNRFIMGPNGTELKGINVFSVKHPETNLPIFASTKLKYNMEKPTSNLEANIVYAAELVSQNDRKLEIQSLNMFIRGIEGTSIDGMKIYASSDHNIVLKSSNGSISLTSHDGVYIDIDRLPIAPDVDYKEAENVLQYKLCLCYPQGILYRVKLPKVKVPDPCRHFDQRFNPCL